MVQSYYHFELMDTLRGISVLVFEIRVSLYVRAIGEVHSQGGSMSLSHLDKCLRPVLKEK